MNAETLLSYFDRIIDSPDAVTRLRHFILDLAVRGKLVEQDPSDETASKLLERIANKKRQSIKASKQIQQTNFLEPQQQASSDSVPKGWAAAQLGDVIHLVSGQHLQPNEYSTDSNDGIPYITGPADFGEAGLTITRYALVRKAVAKQGQILLTVKGAGVGKTAVCNLPQVAISRQLMAMEPLDWSRDFLLLVTHRLADTLKESARSLIPGISRDDVDRFVFAMPPIAEQDRIVARVEELMALCDRMELAQSEREIRRDQLVAASLQRLNQPDKDAGTCRNHANFYLNHLPRLVTRPEQMASLRQAILDLAVRGKLVKQEPTDESALEKADDALLSLQGQGDLINPNGESYLGPLPPGWHWTTLGELALGFRYGTSAKCGYEPVGDPVLRIPNVGNGHVSIDDLKYAELPSRESAELRLSLGDILIVRSNGSLNLVGRPALVEQHVVGYCYAGYLVRVRPKKQSVDPEYLILALNSTFTRTQIERPIRTTVGLKNVNSSELSALAIPLPSLPKQKSIVAMVKELMTLCDQLEKLLTTASTEKQMLLDAVLHHALAPSDEITVSSKG